MRAMPDEVGGFVAQLFDKEVHSEQRLLRDLSGTLPPLAPAPSEVRAAQSLRGMTPSPVRVVASELLFVAARPDDLDGVVTAEREVSGTSMAAEDEHEDDGQSQSQSQSGGVGRIVLTLVIAVLIGGVGFAAWWVLFSDDDPPPPKLGDGPAALARATARDLRAARLDRGRDYASAKRRVGGSCYVTVPGDDARWVVFADGTRVGPLPIADPLRLQAGEPHVIEVRRTGVAAKRVTVSALRCNAGDRFDAALVLDRPRKGDPTGRRLSADGGAHGDAK